jgi:hypothetical protein
MPIVRGTRVAVIATLVGSAVSGCAELLGDFSIGDVADASHSEASTGNEGESGATIEAGPLADRASPVTDDVAIDSRQDASVNADAAADAGGGTGTCAPSPTVTGCASNSTGYACNGSAAPAQGNPALVCSAGVAGGSGKTVYCCTSGGSGGDATGCTPTDPMDRTQNIQCTGAHGSLQCAAGTVCIEYQDAGATCQNGGTCGQCVETLTCACLGSAGLVTAGCTCIDPNTANNLEYAAKFSCP